MMILVPTGGGSEDVTGGGLLEELGGWKVLGVGVGEGETTVTDCEDVTVTTGGVPVELSAGACLLARFTMLVPNDGSSRWMASAAERSP